MAAGKATGKPFKKGHQKTGGRKAGTPNKKTVELTERAAKLGMDPFDILILYANRNWKKLGYDSATRVVVTRGGDAIKVDVIGPEEAITAAKAACEYLHPKRKAIELSNPNGEPLSFTALIAKFSGDGDRGEE